MRNENIGAYQLRGYREAGLRLQVFSHMQIVCFLMRRLMIIMIVIKENKKLTV